MWYSSTGGGPTTSEGAVHESAPNTPAAHSTYARPYATKATSAHDAPAALACNGAAITEFPANLLR